MMKYQGSSLKGVINGGKTFLEFAVHLIEYGYFNPVVFSHDGFEFDRTKYAHVMIGFINLLSFLDTCGITLDTEVFAPDENEAVLYKSIMPNDDGPSEIIKHYVLLEIDFTDLNIQNATTPEGCKDEDFALVKIYLLLKTGAALSRRAIEVLLDKRLSDSEMITIRKRIENITGKKVIKRNDNSYEMR